MTYIYIPHIYENLKNIMYIKKIYIYEEKSKIKCDYIY